VKTALAPALGGDSASIAGSSYGREFDIIHGRRTFSKSLSGTVKSLPSSKNERLSVSFLPFR
jgi:hypothetical protein